MSVLNICAEFRDDRTILSDVEFSAPLKIAKPFYQNDRTKVMVMAATPGLLPGDSWETDIRLEENAALEITGQSFTKIFKSVDGKCASQKTKIVVGKNASLYYFPMPTVPFKDSVYNAETEIRLEKDSALLFRDIFSSGRVACGEMFAFTSFIVRTKIFVGDRLVFFDSLRLVPEEARKFGAELSSVGFFEGFTHTALYYSYGMDFHLPNESNALEGKVGRLFGFSAEEVSIR